MQLCPSQDLALVGLSPLSPKAYVRSLPKRNFYTEFMQKYLIYGAGRGETKIESWWETIVSVLLYSELIARFLDQFNASDSFSVDLHGALFRLEKASLIVSLLSS